MSESIVGKIKQEQIAPVPRWHFLIKSYVFWTLLITSILLGSLSFSVIIHLVAMGDFDVFKYLQGSVLSSTVMMLPYFWFFSLLIFALVAYYNWKHTRLGYKFKRRWIFGASVVFSIFFGSILFSLGMGNKVDRIMARSMPFYDQSRHDGRNEIWLQPDSGLIMGKVVNINTDDNQIIIKDGQGNEWNIDEQAVSPSVSNAIKKGKIVKIIGKKNGEKKFIANEIRKCGDCQSDEDTEVIKVEVRELIKDE